MKSWEIRITCDRETMGPVIQVIGWDVLASLAAVRDVLPVGWQTEATLIL